MLAPGTWADMIHIGVDGPHFAAGLDVPDPQLMANLVWAAGSRAVRDVWVAGDRVVTAGVSEHVDQVAARHAVAAAASHMTPFPPK